MVSLYSFPNDIYFITDSNFVRGFVTLGQNTTSLCQVLTHQFLHHSMFNG
jgi:hypothetical protein